MGYRWIVVPSISEIFPPECFSCPVCEASEGERCLPDCYAGWTRALWWYVEERIGRKLLEEARQAHLAREIAARKAREVVPLATPAPEAEATPAKERRKRRS